MDPVIKVSNLKKIYPISSPKNGQKTFEALKDVSFEVEKGQIFGILGPNGAGKTTALEIIECLRRQTSGMVEVLGLDNLANPEEIKKRIGIQLQSSQYLHHLSLGELLNLFASLYGCRADKKKLLGLVGLENREQETFEKLSGGQKQRFTIASSLVHQPEVLFLDEPTTGLDPAARRSLWDLVKQINSEGITIVMTTHYMEEAEFLCHRVAIMDQGQILEIDEPKKLIDRLSDSVQISFFTEEKIDPSVFQNIPEIVKVYPAHPKVVIEMNSLDKISAVVDALKKNNISFYGFTVKTATLEDVYLKLTGHEYEM